jgi:hypothetical protein
MSPAMSQRWRTLLGAAVKDLDDLERRKNSLSQDVPRIAEGPLPHRAPSLRLGVSARRLPSPRCEDAKALGPAISSHPPRFLYLLAPLRCEGFSGALMPHESFTASTVANVAGWPFSPTWVAIFSYIYASRLLLAGQTLAPRMHSC